MSDGLSKGKDAFTQEVKSLSQRAKYKGIGNTDFGSLHEIDTVLSPSSVCREYARELYDTISQTLAIRTGNTDPVMPFSELDLYYYLAILLRERIKDVNKDRLLFSRNDQDVKIPHFFYIVLYHVGEVVDEQRHIWIRVKFAGDDLTAIEDKFRLAYALEDVEAKRLALAEAKDGLMLYSGERYERDFVYAMSQKLKMLEMHGFVNGSAMPRGLTGDLQFMLFVWMENKLVHPEPNVEPGLALLASLLHFSRSTNILNPYISYGPEGAYRVLLKEVTTPRGQ